MDNEYQWECDADEYAQAYRRVDVAWQRKQAERRAIDTLVEAIRSRDTVLVYSLLHQERIVPPVSASYEILIEAVMRGLDSILRLLLDWRGPDGQYFDALADKEQLMRTSSNYGYNNLTRQLATWTSPDGKRFKTRPIYNFVVPK